MAVHSKEFYKRYTVLLIALVCSLFIPFLLYSFQDTYQPVNSSYEYPSLVKYSYKWPKQNHFRHGIHPMTAKNTDTIKNHHYKAIDQKYCGKDRCKFILPVLITEQESKAQMHFRQLAFLAGKVDRTIVLPNVQNSHLGGCLPHSFDYYYDHSWLDKNKKHFNYITMNDFKAWLAEREEAGTLPTGQEVHIQGARRSKLRGRNCFQKSMDFTGRPSVTYMMRDPANPKQRHGNFTEILMDLLSDEARQHEYFGSGSQMTPVDTFDDESYYVEDRPSIPPVDVINIYYDRRFKFIENPEAQNPLTYNQRWVDIADTISSQLKPFMAIHWRMEQLEPVSNLLPCAEDLVDKIHQLESKGDKKIKAKHPNVFLLTDYPHLLNTTGAKPESNSFHLNQLKSEHHNAIEYLYTHLNITLTSLEDQNIPYAELPQNWHILPIDTQNATPVDRSILGIVDKLVAMRAQWFFAGKPGICAKSSSFTGRISKSREKAFKHGDENIISPLATFNLN